MNNEHNATMISRSAIRRPAAKFVIPNKCVGATPETCKIPCVAIPSGPTATANDQDDFGFLNINSYCSNPLVLAVYRLTDNVDPSKSNNVDDIYDTKYKDSCSVSSNKKKRGRPSKKNNVVSIPSYHSPNYEKDVYEAPWPADFYSSYPFDCTVANYNPECPFDYAGANYISAYPYVYVASMASIPAASWL